MATEQKVEDPTLGRMRRNATLAAAEQLERLRCLDMMAEYRQCISANHQFHQYYIHGEFSQCKIQRARMYNCIKWKSSHDHKAKTYCIRRRHRGPNNLYGDRVPFPPPNIPVQADLLRSFEEEQLSMHPPTPVWRLRDRPPKDWSSSDSGGPTSPSISPDTEGHSDPIHEDKR